MEYYKLFVSMNNIVMFDERTLQGDLNEKIFIYLKHLSEKKSLMNEFSIKFERIENNNKIEQQINKFDVQLLQEQVLLFDNDAEIYSFIQTQILISSNKINQLIHLSFSLIKLCQKYIPKLQHFKKIPQKQHQFYTRQQLSSIQQKCLYNLQIVKQKRKKLDSCVICWQNYANRIIIPCMHLVICKNCINIQKCPICKVDIMNISIVYK